jgi:hypothetical protein
MTADPFVMTNNGLHINLRLVLFTNQSQRTLRQKDLKGYQLWDNREIGKYQYIAILNCSIGLDGSVGILLTAINGTDSQEFERDPEEPLILMDDEKANMAESKMIYIRAGNDENHKDSSYNRIWLKKLPLSSKLTLARAILSTDGTDGDFRFEPWNLETRSVYLSGDPICEKKAAIELTTTDDYKIVVICYIYPIPRSMNSYIFPGGWGDVRIAHVPKNYSLEAILDRHDLPDNIPRHHKLREEDNVQGSFYLFASINLDKVYGHSVYVLKINQYKQDEFENLGYGQLEDERFVQIHTSSVQLESWEP